MKKEFDVPIFLAAKLGLLALCLALSSWALPPNFQEQEWVAAGLDGSPISMTFAPDGRLFTVHTDGSVRIIKNGKLLPTPFVKVQPYMSHRERMLAIAFDPKFSENGYVYLYWQKTSPNRISRFKASVGNPDVAEPNSELVILENGIGGGNGHNGGAFGFGKDGMLYAAFGDDQVRIDPSAFPNIIPKDNPMVNGALSATWSYGFREPFTGAIDTVTGDIVVNDVGQGGSEEVNLIKKGANYGWPACEGSCTKANYTNPWLEYKHNVGSCIAGGAFYYGKQFGAEYRGNYFFGDEAKGWIKRRTSDGQVVDFDTGLHVIDVDVGPDGSLYALRIPSEPPPNPYTAVITRITNTAATALALSYADPRLEGFGPDLSLLQSGASGPVHFHLGRDPIRHASLRVYDRQGRLLDEMEAKPGEPSLLWTPGANAAAGGLFLYALRAEPLAGAALEKRGAFVYQK